MSTLIDKIKNIDDLLCSTGCTTSQIARAQESLDIVFPEEYIEYLKVFGVINFYATEWTGLNIEGYANVVNATLEARKLNPTFPRNCFVLEDLGIEAMMAVMSNDGKVFLVRGKERKLLSNSLSEYLDLCLERGKSNE